MAEELGREMGERMAKQIVMCQKFVLLGRLSSAVTHEVNNQLTGVSGYAQLLMGHDHAQAVIKEVDKIYASANKCQKLIADFKRFSRFADSEKEFDNINIVIGSALGLVRHQFAKRSLQLIENYGGDVPATEVDAPALEQLFLNIIQNSLEALAENGSYLSITTARRNKWIEAVFEDDGPGLSEEAREHLFVPFFTTKGRLRCLGLGLAAAKALAEAHGGIIEVNNRREGGVRATVCLPCEEGRAREQ